MTEAIVNIMIGYFVALASQSIIFPAFGIDIGIEENVMIGAWFTIISLVRSYAIRRFYNGKAA